ncbi:carboxymuconolactone decarboxylase family protein [Ideonella sp. DXS29W]|uniref:Carboxymuconolactone decarboxylase family protein n=1 Tax=Ideonella lacteola TaxID=2984193 RepID=A0ABU9BX50_9BURK
MTCTNTPTESAAYRDGLECLRRIEGTRDPSIIPGLADIAPDLATMAISFVYGQLYTRGRLTLKQRQLITVAALAALGNARPQLKFHVAGALNVGCTASEIVELMMHLVVYAGFPTGLNGVFAAQEVFRERQIEFRPVATAGPAAYTAHDARYRAGWEALMHIDGHAGEKVIESLKELAPDLGRFIIEFGFGDIYTRPGLPLLERELVTVAALAALGTAVPQLKVHLHGLLNVGGTREELVEALMHVAAYAGFPAAINALGAAREVLAERETT